LEARAAIRVDRTGGRTRLLEMRSDPPLTVRSTPDPSRPDVACVHLVGSGAAPLGGDDLHLDVEVGDGAALEVGSVAASLAQPDAARRGSTLTISASIGSGAALTWSGQPTVAVKGGSHHTLTTVRLGAGASLVWRDQLVSGRHEEQPGSVAQTTVVDVVGVGPLYRSTLALGPAWPGSSGPGGSGAGTRSVGSVLVADVDPDRAAERWARLITSGADSPVRAAVMPLDGAGVVLQAVSPLAGALSTFLDHALAALLDGPAGLRARAG